LWLRLAARANLLAKRIGEAAGGLLAAPVESNQIFVKLDPAGLAQLRAAGVQFYDWGAEASGEARFVVSWNQPEAEVEALSALLKSLR
jgi:threonine aldolase